MSPNERFQPGFSLNFCARRPFYLAENDATSDAMSESLVPCYAADLVALSKVSRDGKDELRCLGHIMRQKRSSKITPMAFSSQSLASYLAENGHDIRQLTRGQLVFLCGKCFVERSYKQCGIISATEWYTFQLSLARKTSNGYRFRLTLFWGVAGISVNGFGGVVYFWIVKNNLGLRSCTCHLALSEPWFGFFL